MERKSKGCFLQKRHPFFVRLTRMFRDRKEASEKLARQISFVLPFFDDEKPLVVGIPRGGLVTAEIVAKELSLPLDGVIVKKIPSPQNIELAIGAVGEGKEVYWDREAIGRLRIGRDTKRLLLEKSYEEVEEREKLLNSGRERVFKDTIILVDDGVATGSTVLCAQKILREKGAVVVILATPVIAPEVFEKLRPYFQKIIYLQKPVGFEAVGEVYENFPQVEDRTVIEILNPR